MRESLELLGEFSSYGTLRVSKRKIREFGLNNTMFLTALINLETETLDDFVRATKSDIYDMVGLNERQQNECIKFLTKLGYIEVIYAGFNKQRYIKVVKG